MEIINFNKMDCSDKKSLELVWTAYNHNTKGLEEIFEIGYNLYSGYVYLALENGVSIASCFGQSVDYIVTDMENGEEFFFDFYNQAINKLEKLHERV